MSLLGIDLGTSGCKAVAFARDGRPIATAEHRYSPVHSAPDRVELDTGHLSEAVAATVQSVTALVGSDHVEALAIAAHGETVIPVDANNRPQGPALLNADNRAGRLATQWRAEVGEERIFHLTGTVIHPMYALLKAQWLLTEGGLGATTRFLGPAEIVLADLGLNPYTDPSLAARWMAFDLHQRTWSNEILKQAGISSDRLPLIRPAGSIVGQLGYAAAKRLGIREGTPVVLGGHDQAVSALGAGVIDPGAISVSSGSYECLVTPTTSPAVDANALAQHRNATCHVVADRYLSLAFFPAGLMTAWFARTLMGTSEDLLEAACPDQATGILVTPHLVGACTPQWNPAARAMIVGLDARSDRGVIYRAILEGIAREFAENLAILPPAQNIRIHGGGTRSPLGLRLRSTYADRALDIVQGETTCRGAAILAGLGLGIWSKTEDAITAMVHTNHRVEPDPGLSAAIHRQRQRADILGQTISNSGLFSGTNP